MSRAGDVDLDGVGLAGLGERRLHILQLATDHTQNPFSLSPSRRSDAASDTYKHGKLSVPDI